MRTRNAETAYSRFEGDKFPVLPKNPV